MSTAPLTKAQARLWAPILGAEVLELAVDGRSLRPHRQKMPPEEREKRRIASMRKSTLKAAAMYRLAELGLASAGSFHSSAAANDCAGHITEGTTDYVAPGRAPSSPLMPCGNCGTWTTDIAHCTPFQWDQIELEDEPRVGLISQATWLSTQTAGWRMAHKTLAAVKCPCGVTATRRKGAKYCSEACMRKYGVAAYYRKHRAEILAKRARR